MSEQLPVIVIGAGHAGLAVSNLLTGEGVEHVVLDRHGIASTWERERWDSFTLLTPNWATWLPDWHYDGSDPDGFMGRDEIVSYFTRYAESFGAPVRSPVDVSDLSVSPGGALAVGTSGGDITAQAVVVATGPFQSPRIPAWSSELPSGITQIHSRDYRSPAQLADGAVLVVGAGPSGQQIAEDLILARRSTYLSVGRHRRVPRRYRGRDYYWWLELGGFYEKTAEDVPLARRRDSVAPALTGARDTHDLDLRDLHAQGVGLLGRTVGVEDGHLLLEAGLAASLAAGDRAYTDFTDWAEDRLYRFTGLYGDLEPRPSFPEPPEPPAQLDLASAGVSTVIWATGFRSDHHSWVTAPVFGPDGHLDHRRGVTAVPGLYFVGLSWLHRLRSPFIRGAEEDARHIVKEILGHLRG